MIRTVMAALTMRNLLHHFNNRVFELSTSIMMLAMAIHLVIWPTSLSASGFRLMLRVISEQELALFFFAGGTLRIVALIANGAWPFYGPIMRAIGAFCGASIWGQMFVALLLLVPNVGNPPSPGIPVYFTLAVFELVSMYRALLAVKDVSESH